MTACPYVVVLVRTERFEVATVRSGVAWMRLMARGQYHFVTLPRSSLPRVYDSLSRDHRDGQTQTHLRLAGPMMTV